MPFLRKCRKQSQCSRTTFKEAFWPKKITNLGLILILHLSVVRITVKVKTAEDTRLIIIATDDEEEMKVCEFYKSKCRKYAKANHG